MTEQCLCLNGERLPASFVCGLRPIDGAFATAGISCANAMIFQKHGEVCNNRFFVLDFKSESVIGDFTSLESFQRQVES